MRPGIRAVRPVEGGPHGKGSRLQRQERQAVRGPAQEGHEQVPRGRDLELRGQLQPRRQELRQQPEQAVERQRQRRQQGAEGSRRPQGRQEVLVVELGARVPDTRGVKKAVNKVKSTLEAREGPVRKEQDAVPIADAMRAYWERGMLTFSIPAHSGGRGPAPEFTQWAGIDAARSDLPMSHGVDTRDRAWKVQATAQELFADAVGAKQTLFSTNGSTLSAHVAIMAVAGPGDTLVMARNGHKSAFA